MSLETETALGHISVRR